MNILGSIAFSKIIGDFSFNFFCFFQLWKISPPGQGEVRQGSRKIASGVKEKCQGSRRSALGVKEKCFHWMCGIQLKHFSLTPDTLFLDPRRTSPWPLTHFSLTPDALLLDLEGLFFIIENSKKLAEEKSKIIFENALYLKIFLRFSG